MVLITEKMRVLGMNRKEQLEKLLKEKKIEKKLHDFYLENPDFKFKWVRKKYSKEDYVAFFLSIFFMFSVFLLMFYFLSIGFFQPVLLKEKEINVILLDSYSRGEKIIQVVYEPAVNQLANSIKQTIKKTLINPKNNINDIDSINVPNFNLALSNNINIQMDPLGKPFEISLGWKCKNIKKERGEQIKVKLSLYQRKFDRNNFYKFRTLDKICVN